MVVVVVSVVVVVIVVVVAEVADGADKTPEEVRRYHAVFWARVMEVGGEPSGAKLLERVEQFKNDDPGKGWDGVFRATSK